MVISKSVVILADTAAAHFSARSMPDLLLYVRRIDGYWMELKLPTASCSISTSGEKAENVCDHACVFAGVGLDTCRAVRSAYGHRISLEVNSTRHISGSMVYLETSVPRCSVTPKRPEATLPKYR